MISLHNVFCEYLQVLDAVTRKERALHCRRRTRGVDVTTDEIQLLLERMRDRTNEVGVPLFDWEDMSAIWKVDYVLCC